MKDYDAVSVFDFGKVFFRCDKCGKEYGWTNAYCTAEKGQTYMNERGEKVVADMDLCRDCNGFNKRRKDDGMIDAEIAYIDGCTIRELEG